MERKEYDVIIIGNGAIGCSIAISLVNENPNISIALIGEKKRTGSASMAAGMMLNLFAELEDNSLTSSFYRQKFEMGLKAKKLWENWVQTINDLANTNLAVNEGTYVLNNTANTEEREDKNFDYIIKNLEEYQTNYELGIPKYIKGYYPEDRYRAKNALYIPSEGSIETARLFSVYDSILKTHPNISIVGSNATDITIKDYGIKYVKTALSLISADKIVICAGAYSQPLIEQLPIPKGRIPTLFYGHGTGLHIKTQKELKERTFELPDKVIRTTTRGTSCGLNIVPYNKFNCYVGASNFPLDYEEEYSQVNSVYEILDVIMKEFNKKFASALFKTIIGHRPISADTYPLIGQTSVNGVWIVSGTKREGVFLSPFIAASITREIMGEQSLTPSCFLPERSLISDLTRKEGIDKAVVQQLSTLYSYGFVSPKIADDFVEKIRVNYRIEMEELYDKLGLKDYGIPPELIRLYKEKQIKPK